MARERIEDMIVSSLKSSGDVVVDISVFPALKALNGRIDSVYVHAQDVTIGEVPMSEIEVDARNVAWPVGLGQDEIMDLRRRNSRRKDKDSSERRQCKRRNHFEDFRTFQLQNEP